MRKYFCFTSLSLLLCVGFMACDKESDSYVVTDKEEDDEPTAEDVSSANESISDYDSDINSVANLTIDDAICITWDGASVTVAGSAEGVEVVANAADVTITSTTDSVINYVLCGTSADGSVKLYSDHKCVVTLDNLTLTSATSAAINNQGDKSLYVYLPEGSISTLADAPTYTAAVDGEDCKACLFSEGQMVLCGTGTLAITGNYKHALATDDYLVLNEELTLNILGSATDAIHTNDYIVIEAGTIRITDAGSDGIDSEGAISIAGGRLDIATSALTGKALKAVGDITITGGELVFVANGDAEWNSGTGEEADYSNAACIKTSGSLHIDGGTITARTSGTAGRGLAIGGDLNLSAGTLAITTTGSGYQYSTSCDYTTATAVKVKGNMNVTGGEIVANVSGAGSKALKIAGTYTQSEGKIVANATGANLGTSASSGGGPGMWGGTTTSSGYSASAKGVKITGALKLTGGALYGTSAKHEAVETKSTLDVTGGSLYGYSAADDGVNAGSHFTIAGGNVCGYAPSNDGLDANGNLYIKGGVVFAVGSSSPEMAIDANTEGGYKLYVSGGTLMTVGPLESGASLTQACYSTSTWTKGAKYALTVGSDTYVFTTPTTTAGSSLVVSGASTPTLK
ncbi:MAG: carbohydrate-binding domain-containing protein, partial [Bacteroidales bacterium]|nr:carbohydrate-binding domain-containing protein [Bacteroidales bacterium]